MAGDPLCDAFRLELQAVLDAATPPITWEVVDTDNDAAEPPDASTPYIQLRFEGGQEALVYWGSPGSNWWREDGQVFVDFLVPLGDGREEAERHSRTVREAFRDRRFNTAAETGSVEIRIETVSPLFGGQGVEGGLRVKTIAFGYRIYNVG